MINQNHSSLIVGSALAVGLLLLSYAYFVEPSRLVIRQETIFIKNWNPEFDGFRVALIADIHGGSNGADAEKIRRVVAETNGLRPDLIVLLGDYVSQRSSAPAVGGELKMPMHEVAENLRGLSAPYGVVAVLGNHDGWYGDDIVRQELEGVGYKVLENQVLTIVHGDHKLRILGLEDHLKVKNWQWLSAKAKRALDEAGGTGDVVVLEHSPDILPMITGDLSISPDLKLILAAHTHGGQVWLPVIGSPVVPSSYGQKYAFGHIRDAEVDMYVTSGVGTSILPFRFLVPPEIALVTIRRE
jgi:predicted MPP superfamily phosphohydrolase